MDYDGIKASFRTVRRLIARDDLEAADALVKHVLSNGGTVADMHANLTKEDVSALRDFSREGK